jgi:hypothetical protein
MKSLWLTALGGLCLSAPAMAAPESTITVHASDPLAVAAIQQGDLARAEAILSDGRLEADDPLRLINLGDVYWLSGRQGEAVAAWRRALGSRNQYDVETVGGRVLPTYEIAREALALHGRPVLSASNN